MIIENEFNKNSKKPINDIIFNISNRLLFTLQKYSIIEPIIRSIRKKKQNYSHLATEIISKINNIHGDKVFPFFGTLLSIVRDGEFSFADDFDFATFNKEILSIESIDKLKTAGFEFYRFSYIKDIGVVEISLLYKGANVDIFLLDTSLGITHYCPNFRTKAPNRKVFSKAIISKYDDYFTVRYSRFNLSYSPKWQCFIPLNAETIFEQHYGHDWMIPKSKGFIDFNNYKFIKHDAYTIQNNSMDIGFKSLYSMSIKNEKKSTI